ncbi:unnamed protein product, partial [Amoebophrya sp. A120]|eukprot:GSA120T00002887001.1
MSHQDLLRALRDRRADRSAENDESNGVLVGVKDSAKRFIKDYFEGASEPVAFARAEAVAKRFEEMIYQTMYRLSRVTVKLQHILEQSPHLLTSVGGAQEDFCPWHLEASVAQTRALRRQNVARQTRVLEEHDAEDLPGHHRAGEAEVRGEGFAPTGCEPAELRARAAETKPELVIEELPAGITAEQAKQQRSKANRRYVYPYYALTAADWDRVAEALYLRFTTNYSQREKDILLPNLRMIHAWFLELKVSEAIVRRFPSKSTRRTAPYQAAVRVPMATEQVKNDLRTLYGQEVSQQEEAALKAELLKSVLLLSDLFQPWRVPMLVVSETNDAVNHVGTQLLHEGLNVLRHGFAGKADLQYGKSGHQLQGHTIDLMRTKFKHELAKDEVQA